MKKILTFTLVLTALTLSGCSFIRPHHENIEQGNQFTQTMIDRLRIGMSAKEVENIMGHPVLKNIFDDNRMDYVYTYQRAYSIMQEDRVTCIFRDGRLKIIRRGL